MCLFLNLLQNIEYSVMYSQNFIRKEDIKAEYLCIVCWNPPRKYVYDPLSRFFFVSILIKNEKYRDQVNLLQPQEP